MKNATEILKYAMNMERKAQEFYNFYKDKVSSKKIKELFEGLASMEEEHYSILERQLDSLEKNNSFTEINLNEADGESIIQNKTKDMFNSTILIFSGKSYMFNCCEGTQRNAADQGIRFKNINSIS